MKGCEEKIEKKKGGKKREIYWILKNVVNELKSGEEVKKRKEEEGKRREKRKERDREGEGQE